jgi:hypothetical protein
MTVLLEEVVFGEPDGRETRLVCGLNFVKALLQQDPFVIRHPGARQGELVEQRDFHCYLL